MNPFHTDADILRNTNKNTLSIGGRRLRRRRSTKVKYFHLISSLTERFVSLKIISIRKLTAENKINFQINSHLEYEIFFPPLVRNLRYDGVISKWIYFGCRVSKPLSNWLNTRVRAINFIKPRFKAFRGFIGLFFKPKTMTGYIDV